MVLSLHTKITLRNTHLVRYLYARDYNFVLRSQEVFMPGASLVYSLKYKDCSHVSGNVYDIVMIH